MLLTWSSRPILTTVKTVTVKQVQASLPDLLRLVAGGEEVRIVRRRRPVAALVPVGRPRTPVDWAETWARVDAIFGGKPAPGKPGSRLIRERRR